MKIFLFILLLSPLSIIAQPDPGEEKELVGLWKGYLKTAEKTLPYELVITEKDGKLLAYSYTTFTVNGKDLISVKLLSIHWQNSSIIIDDKDLLFDNFPTEAPKKIKQSNILFLKKEKNIYQLTGMFESKATRTIQSARGAIYLEKKQTSADTKILAKLDELQLASSLSFSISDGLSKPTTDSEIAVAKKPVIPIVEPSPAPIASAKVVVPEPKKEVAAPVPAPAPPVVAAAKTNPPPTPTVPVNKPAIVSKQPAPPKPTVVAKPAPVPAAPKVVAATTPIVVNNPVAAKPVVKNVAVAPVLDLSARKIETIKQLYIESDSLQLTLYDNGIVDGDTVSIILNGKTIISKQMLSTVPFTKTIYFTPDMGDTLQLVMYAESLGSLPPNTGLLILQYDKERNEIRFSGDLTKNAAITLRRKEKNTPQ